MTAPNFVPTTFAKAGAMCIDGIDVDQLLRDIGEASANTAAVDLFGLLLGAQRVLAQVQAGSPVAPAVVAQGEAELLAAYGATSDAGKDYLCGMARQLQRSFPRQRLGLVGANRHQRWEAV